MSQKLYESERWMRLKYLRQRLSVEEIAEICNVKTMTIYRAITKFKLKR
jgi:DeoR/GlpR family transcriptional regulator of sugar metabolism